MRNLETQIKNWKIMNWNEYLSFSSLPFSKPDCSDPQNRPSPEPLTLFSQQGWGFGAQQFGAFIQHMIFQHLLFFWVCWRAALRRMGLHCSTTMLEPEKGFQEIRLSSDLIKLRPNMIQCISDLTDTHIKPNWCIVLTDSKPHTCGPAAGEVTFSDPGSPLLSTHFCSHKLFQNFCRPQSFCSV